MFRVKLARSQTAYQHQTRAASAWWGKSWFWISESAPRRPNKKKETPSKMSETDSMNPVARFGQAAPVDTASCALNLMRTHVSIESQ